MKKIIMLAAMACTVTLTSCKDDKRDEVVEDKVETTTVETTKSEDMNTGTADKKVTVQMNPKSDSNVSGSIVFRQDGKTVSMTALFSGLTPGMHAIHLHENGDCSSADGKSAGGHWEGMSAMHGKWGEGDHHSGDIGNLEANAEGNASLSFSTDKWCIGCGDAAKDVMGHSVIVHAGVDDLKSQPSGAAGARVACGVIR